MDDIVGAVDRLQPRTPAAQRALRDLLAPMGDVRPQSAGPPEQDGRLQRELALLLDDTEEDLQPRRLAITSEDRAIGAHLSGELVRADRLLGVGSGTRSIVSSPVAPDRALARSWRRASTSACWAKPTIMSAKA